VIFFRHGKGPNPVGWGHAYPPNTGQTVPPIVPLLSDDVKYVSLPNARDWDTPDNGNFIGHEVSHYLGLFHTHPGWGTSDLYPSGPILPPRASRRLSISPPPTAVPRAPSTATCSRTPIPTAVATSTTSAGCRTPAPAPPPSPSAARLGERTCRSPSL